MHVDDILILSEFEVGLQLCLDLVPHAKLLSINSEKTKCIVFQKKNRKTNKIQFHVENTILDTGSQYVYVGISNSFQYKSGFSSVRIFSIYKKFCGFNANFSLFSQHKKAFSVIFSLSYFIIRQKYLFSLYFAIESKLRLPLFVNGALHFYQNA